MGRGAAFFNQRGEISAGECYQVLIQISTGECVGSVIKYREGIVYQISRGCAFGRGSVMKILGGECYETLGRGVSSIYREGSVMKCYVM